MPSRKSTTTKSSHGRKGKHTPHESLPTGWHFQAPRWLRALCRYSSLVICSLALSTGLFSLSSQITQGDLAWTSRQYDSWWGIGGLLAWRTAELTVVWLSGYDARDAASFTYLTHLPTYVLLYSFYGIRPTTLMTVAFITLLSTAIPFFVFRGPSRIHQMHPFMVFQCCDGHTTLTAISSTKTTKDDIKLRHPTILADCPTTVYTTLVASGIYTLILYSSVVTWLPTYLVTYYDGLPDIRIAHAGAKSFISLLATLLPAGYALRDFLFVSSVGAERLDEQRTEDSTVDLIGPGKEAREQGDEAPSGELLVMSVYRKYWLELPAKTRSLLSRTIELAVMIMFNTVVQVVGTINGAEVEGAVGWGSIWTLATCVTGVMFGWVEAADGL
ncbi:conserved hypothetical protein [Histoplasma capsulatum G186AR]|uniref:Uncharacterized protein n=2 Tax=Ajellomyces capsulatus TaxID=5037 RepID=C0NW20_AJECG|nr:uncharacterized protein HCBG_07350 [Histoplasma capsulatum G186AR]EEH04125.1 conserved hypothetical protein [Histoplasma capsulatum G186AR]KAG5299008.1 hypothetical protein I7I52_09170 [Histoplasma capsulatum]QSS68373.1 hypothetical protein I7I50_07757 [Histoplasma capsulatum G186AR]